MDVIAAADRWRRMLDERAEQMRTVQPSGNVPSTVEDRAAQFLRATREPQADRLLDLMLERVQPGSVALDVGAGAGRYALPLARAGATVIAVEPSAVMGGMLRQEADAAGLGEAVTLLPATWQDAEAPEADLSVCAHVIYGVREIVPFIDKMRRLTRDAVFLVVRATQMDAHIADLWRQVYGVERRSEPSFVDLYLILEALGVSPNVETMPFGMRRSSGPGGGYATEDDAAESARRLLYAEPDPVLDRRIRTYMGERMEQRNGRLYWKGPSMRSAILWWTKADETAPQCWGQGVKDDGAGPGGAGTPVLVPSRPPLQNWGEGFAVEAPPNGWEGGHPRHCFPS
ncbi:MAG: class I SAM-dependent methyltransferase [Chloroflexi bacterium]|nr:class I SAM-dependent methyltransferase [Chloroflexota bacterium]